MSDDWGVLAEESAADARMFLLTVREIAAGNAPEAALPMVLLALSQVLVMGARLGAIEDVVPVARFEVDPGPDAELDPLRESLANVFEGLDEYADVADPVIDPEPTVGCLSNDLADIASALTHGLSHFDAGRRLRRHGCSASNSASDTMSGSASSRTCASKACTTRSAAAARSPQWER